MAKSRRRIPRYIREAEIAADEALQAGEVDSRGRIQADLTQQAPNNSYGPAKLYYEDLPFICRDCGSEQVWTAQQQQWWYEVAKGPIYSTAVRCRACRQARRAGQVRRGENPPA
jgi:hypothetical protein